MKDSNCILWTGIKFGLYGFDKGMTAHRRAWERAYGKVPHGLIVHHDCQNTLCVNPDHLMAVTHAEHRRLHPQDSSLRCSPKFMTPRRESMPDAIEIKAALLQSHGNKRAAAAILKISRRTLYDRLDKMSLL